MASSEGVFELPNGAYLAYKQHKAKEEDKSNKPGIIFLCGWGYNLNSKKAECLARYCETHDLNYTRFSYNGHTPSSGTMVEFSVGLGLSNALDVLDNLTKGPQILVGFSVGGLIALLTAMKRPERIQSILSINNGADFVYKKFLEHVGDDSCMDDLFDTDGFIQIEPGMRLSRSCIEDAKKHRLLCLPSIEITCPVTFIHGMQDEIVSYQTSIKLAELIKSSKVEIRLVKNAMHDFTEKDNLTVMIEELHKLLGGDDTIL